MLEIYTRHGYITVGNNLPIVIRECEGVVMLNDVELSKAVEPWKFPNAAALYDFLTKHHFPGLYNSRRHRLVRRPVPCVVCNDGEDHVCIDIDDNCPIVCRIEYKPCRWMSLEQIMRRFPAEKTIQYLKERGMSVCPLTKEL